MAKGIAVVSGSNDVVFKALETGIVTIGSTQGLLGTYAKIGVSGSLSVSGSAEGTRSFYVDENGVEISGSFGFTGDLNVTGSVYATQDVSASQDLKAGRHLIAAGNLDVEGTGNLKDKLTIQTGGLEVDGGETILADKLTVESNGLEVTGNVDVNGNISGSANLSVGGTLDVGSTANIADALTVESGGLFVTGSSDFKDNVTIRGNLTVHGDTTVTVDNLKNMTVEDAITQFGIGADGASDDIGFVFGDSNRRALIVDGGIFKLGTTSDDASSASVTVADDGILVLGQVTASVGILAKDVHIQDGLVVEDNVTLGQDSSDIITINGVLTASADVLFQEDVTMGTFDGAGTEASDLVKVVGSIRMPVFTTAGDPLTGSFPVIPADYVTNKANYNGYMFYLTGSDDTNWTTTDANWKQSNKWYFNERGDWHASFLFAE